MDADAGQWTEISQESHGSRATETQADLIVTWDVWLDRLL